MTEHVYRIDKFVVPTVARNEFLHRIEETHAILKGCQGFVRDEILEQPGDDKHIHLITSVEWTGTEALDNAGCAVRASHVAAGFDVRSFIAGLGITAEFGLYRSVARAMRTSCQKP